MKDYNGVNHTVDRRPRIVNESNYKKIGSYDEIGDPEVKKLVDDLIKHENDKERKREYLTKLNNKKQSRTISSQSKPKSSSYGSEPTNLNESKWNKPKQNKSKQSRLIDLSKIKIPKSVIIGSLIGGGVGLLGSKSLESKLRSKLKSKYPDKTEYEIDSMIQKYTLLLTSASIAAGAGIGYKLI